MTPRRIQLFSLLLGFSVISIWSSGTYFRLFDSSDGVRVYFGVRNSTIDRNVFFNVTEEEDHSLGFLTQLPFAVQNPTSRITTTTAATASLIDSKVTLVHLLSYQRSGSSFAGGLLHSNPDAFFIYEPMDMLYTALYGISPGWSVPADIFYSSDGVLRKIPEIEQELSLWTLEQVYNCSMSSFPLAMLLHPFWKTFGRFMPDSKPYAACMASRKASLDVVPRACMNKLITVCPKRFDPNAPLNKCKEVLWNNGTWSTSAANVTRRLDLNTIQKSRFNQYFECINRYEKSARFCAKNHLDKPCESKSIRGVKTVRTSMEVSRRLLEKHPNSRVIHLLRDPRGVTRSRTVSATWALGLHERGTVTAHADRYCRAAVRDYRDLLALKTAHPGRASHVVYDGFVQDPQTSSREIYRLIGRDMPPEVSSWLENSTRPQTVTVLKSLPNRSTGRHRVTQAKETQTSKSRSTAWISYYNPAQQKEFRESCRDFYETVDFSWNL